jgi:hypothetical protein
MACGKQYSTHPADSNLRVLVGERWYNVQQNKPLRLLIPSLTQQRSAADTFARVAGDDSLNAVMAFCDCRELLVLEMVSSSMLRAVQRSRCWSFPRGITAAIIDSNAAHVTPEQARQECLQYLAAAHRVHVAWKQVDVWAHGTLAWTLNEGLTHAEMTRIEQRLGKRLPLEVRASYALHDGQASSACMSFLLSRTAHLPLQEAADEALRLPEFWGGASTPLLLPMSRGQGQRQVAVGLDDGKVRLVMPMSSKVIANSWSEYLIIR